MSPRRSAFSIGRQSGADPSGERRIPCGRQIALAPGGRREPVRRRRARRIRTDLDFHAIEDPLVHRAPLDVGLPPRIPVDRARPPVEQAVARRRREKVGTGQHRSEDRRGRARQAVEEQRLAETDHVFDPLRRAESRGVQGPQTIACVRQVLGGGALAIALEKRAGRNQVRAVGARRGARGFLGRRKRRGELPLVVQHPRPFERVARLGRKARPGQAPGKRKNPRPERCRTVVRTFTRIAPS